MVERLLQIRDHLNAPRLTFIEHLEELRRRLGICLITVIVTSGVTLCVGDRLIGWLKRPAGELLPRLAFFSPTEALGVYFKVAVVGGLVLALPMILYQVWAFLRPGLTQRERSYVLAFVWWGSALFVTGAAVAYWFFLPFFLRFLLTVGSQHLEPIISVNRYLSFVLGVIVMCGVLFELPIVVFVLTRMGVITPTTLRRHRGAAILGLVIVAAVVTPTTDALSLILFTIPLLVLYELSVIVASVSARTRAKPSREG